MTLSLERDFWHNHQSLFTVPVFLLVLVAALDAADKSLLAASFPVLRKTWGLSVDMLGYFSLVTNLSSALSLPLWGWLIHYLTHDHAHNLLASACFSWGIASLLIAHSQTITSQLVLRSVNGAALASIMPLSQMMLIELVPSSMRGRAFGMMGFCEKTASTFATSAIVWWKDWRLLYRAVGGISVIMAFWVRRKLAMKSPRTSASSSPAANNEDDSSISSKEDKEISIGLSQIVKGIFGIPAFGFLVAQGVFGAVPWNMMSFVLLLLDWKGFGKEQIVSLQVSAGICATVGSALGGYLGDWFGNSHYSTFANPQQGRIGVALASVTGGLVCWGLFLSSSSYPATFIFYNLFHLVGTWTAAAAIRPICCELARNPSERAQVVAFWIFLESTSSALLGAPLVGFLTSRMMDHSSALELNHEKAHALALNLFFLSTLFWGICAVFWVLMGRSIDCAYRKIHSQSHEANDGEENGEVLVAILP